MKIHKKNIDVIVPTHNEEEIISTFYNRIMSLNMDINLIFVDNASHDNTITKLESFKDVTIIRHDKNEGYGGSIIDGIKRSDGDIVVIIDADCEYPPESIPEIIDELEDSDVVYGSRFLKNNSIDMAKSRIAGNKIITGLYNWLFHQSITDLYTGFKAFNRSVLKDITLTQQGFEHVLEMGIKFAKRNITIHEIPIVYTPRSTGRSKMKHFTETLKYLYYLIYYRITL